MVARGAGDLGVSGVTAAGADSSGMVVRLSGRRGFPLMRDETAHEWGTQVSVCAERWVRRTL